MPLDTSNWAGRAFDEFRVAVTGDMIRSFARAVGETATDEAPPTFPMRIYMNGTEARSHLDDLGIPLDRVLHSEQEFFSLRPILAGADVVCSTRVDTVSASSSGRMIFVTFAIDLGDDDGPLASMLFSIAVRNTP